MNGIVGDILMVEDNENDIELAMRALKKHNLVSKILVMRDGAAALEYILNTGSSRRGMPKSRPKVILLDLKLPKISGLEVLRRIKSDDNTKTIPVVVLTSSREEKDIVESYNLGVNSYIIKPVDFEKFVDAVAEVGLYWSMLNEYPHK